MKVNYKDDDSIKRIKQLIMRYLKEFSKIQDYNKVANVLKDVSDILNEMEANKTTDKIILFLFFWPDFRGIIRR